MRRESIAALMVPLTIASLTGCGRAETTKDATAVSSIVVVESESLESTTTVETTVADLSRRPIFDFPSADDVIGWSVVNDTVMGGVSSGRLDWKDRALVFSGELSLDNNGGFASVRSPIIDPALAADWSNSEGLKVELRSERRTWTVEVRMAGDDGGWTSQVTTSAELFSVATLSWTTFEPVTRFLDSRVPIAPLDPSRIASIAFYLVDGVEGTFRLEVRSVA